MHTLKRLFGAPLSNEEIIKKNFDRKEQKRWGGIRDLNKKKVELKYRAMGGLMKYRYT